MVSGSLALISDAWHTLSDSLSSIVVIIGLKLSRRKPTTKHPFGFGRWEQIAAMFVGIMLAVVAYEFFVDAIGRLQNHQSAQFGTVAIVVTIISIIVKEGLAQYAFWVYRQTGLLTMKADGWHHRSDAISSVVVLIGIFVGRHIWWIDAVLGIIVALMLVGVCIEIVKSSVAKLLGETVPKELEDEITAYICEHFGDYHTDHYHIHFYGDHRELTFHLHVNGSDTVDGSHQLATQIEDAIQEHFHLESTIHIEPIH
jgi:cation diffusion facilitator family transporter